MGSTERFILLEVSQPKFPRDDKEKMRGNYKDVAHSGTSNVEIVCGPYFTTL